jgi:amino acid adenylation domain-containing protein
MPRDAEPSLRQEEHILKERPRGNPNPRLGHPAAVSTLKSSASLVTLIRSQAEQRPNKTALRFLGDRDGDVSSLTYAEVDRGARAVAAHLRAAGAVGERALVLHPPGLPYISALLGCFYAGVVAVPAYPPRFNRSMERLRDIVIDARARFALTTAAAIEKIERYTADEPELSGLTWIATDQVDESLAQGWAAPQQDSDSIAFLQYTSGSTSAPKGVVLSHGNLLANMDGIVRLLGITGEDSGASWLPPYHDMGLIGTILLPLCIGAQSTLLSPTGFLQRPLRWLQAISSYRATICSAPNFAYELCTRRIGAEQIATLDLRSWRTALCGAERVRADTLERFAQAFAPAGFRHGAFAPSYGLAESTLAVSCDPGDSAPRVGRLDDLSLVSCGRPLADSKLLIVDPDTGACKPDDAVGEIWVSGPSVAQGYWQNPELSRQTFGASPQGASRDDSTRYLRTGDLGFMRDGELYVAGRIKDLIVLRGLNFYAEDIEETLADCHPRLRLAGAAAFGVEAADEEGLVIVHEIDSLRGAPLEEMVEAIKTRIAEAHEIMVHAVVLLPPGGLPKTSSGKVQRRRCRELYLSGELPSVGPAPTAFGRDTAAPPELVGAVAALMADLLGMQSIGATDDFFWLGGHSLLATQLVSRIRDKFAVDLPLRSVFDAKTPQALAARIAAAPKLAALPPIELADRNGPLALSFSQERMWYLHQLYPDSAAYNVSGAVLLEGRLNVDALHRAFEEVVKRHEVLRTNYPTIDGAPQVRISGGGNFPFDVDDCRGAPDPLAAATAAASELAAQPFDIAADPLLRVAVHRIGPQTHLLCASMHHLVTDAWSLGLLVADMLRFYDAFNLGKDPVRPAEQLSYVDYAQWQRRHFTDDFLRKQLVYWKQQLQGASPVELPADRRRSMRRTWAGAHLPLALSNELFDTLGALAAAHGTTLFMLMLAAFEVLLYRYTGRTDLVVGIPVANRNWRAAESLMGSLVNTLALRLRFDENADFAQLLRQVREVALDAYANQDLPFERLVSELAVERKPGESPIVSVMFDFQNAPMPGRADRELRMSPLMLSRGASQFDLSILMLDSDFGRMAGIEYNTELFDAATVKRLADHYRCILETIAVQPTEAISRIPMLGRCEREELLNIAAGSGADAPLQGVYSSFEEHAKRAPDAAAVTDRHGTMTYAELDRSASLLASELRGLGAGPGTRIAVCVQRDRRMITALLAALKTGAAYVPLDPNYPPDRIKFVLGDAAPCVLLTDRESLSMLPQPLSTACVCLDETGRAAPALEPAQLPPRAASDRDAAYVIYTSGSTGRPKGVEISVGALENFLRSMRHTPGMVESDRLLSVTTIAFDIAGLELWLPLTSGACVHLVESAVAVDGRSLLELMRRVRPTIMQATPSTWAMLMEAGWSGDEQLKILCGGEALSADLARELLARGRSVWNMYGPTETTIWSALHRVTEGDSLPIPIGRPIDRTSIHILDRHGNLLPFGVPGEIYIGGAGVANGYFGRPDLTLERFVPDPFSTTPGARLYRTGDAGRMRGDGVIECLGRLDDQIKLRGFRIEPGEIEAVLKQQEGVSDALIVARQNALGQPYLAAYYIAADGAALPQLTEPLRRMLPSYMIPGVFVALQSFPRTPNGKIDRSLLPTPSLPAAAADEYLAPRDDLERRLAEIWSDILGTARPGIRDSFFLLGGHSLLAVRMFARIERQFAVALPLTILHERPTIEYLADTLRPHCGEGAPSRGHLSLAADRFSFLVPIQRRGRRPRLFCVHGAGGNVLNLSSIARHLGSDQPFVALQAQGTDGIRQPLDSVDAMANRYIEEVRGVQPHGPYYLSGYCGGGIIAFEMARLLRNAGEQVALLTLIDCYAPGPVKSEPRLRRWKRETMAGGLKYLQNLAAARIRRNYHSAASWLKVGMYRLKRQSIPYELRDVWLTRTFLRAAARYRPGVYRGRLTLLRATEVEPALLAVGPDMGWTNLASDVRTFDIPGTHHTIMEEPNVGVLADLLKRCLETAEADSAR